MKKIKSLVTAAVVATTVLTLHATIYVPGLAQAQFSGGSSPNRDHDILSQANLTYVDAPIMTSTGGSAKDWKGKAWSWANNRSFGYIGEMYMVEGVTYTFAESVDDWTMLLVDDEQVFVNSAWDIIGMGSYTAEFTGWHKLEIRTGNGGGGCGLVNNAACGLAYNTTNNTSTDDFKALANGWTKLIDSGDASLLRIAYSQESYITESSVTIDGDNLNYSISFSNIPQSGATVKVVYGEENGGEVASAWDEALSYDVTEDGTISGTIENYIENAKFISFCVIANSSETNYPWVEWTRSFSFAFSEPVFEVKSATIGYGDLSYVVNIVGIGLGAESVSATFQLSTTEDFSNIVFEKDLSVNTFGSETVVANGLVPTTDYYARVVGKNNLDEESESNIVGPVTTLTITPSEIAYEIDNVSWNSISTYFIVADFGDGSDYVDIYLDVSTDSSFAKDKTLTSIAVKSSSEAPFSGFVEVDGLIGATSYYARMRSINTWELETISQTVEFSTIQSPFATTQLQVVNTKNAADVSTTLTYIVDGCVATAVLYDNGVEVMTFDSITVENPLVQASINTTDGKAHNLKLVVSVVADSVEYTKELTATVMNGDSSIYAFASPAELEGKVLQVGDKAIFEVANGITYYVNGDGVAQIGEDAHSFTTVNPGICFLEVRDAYEGTKNRYIFFVAPKIPTSADIFYVDVPGNTSWTTAKWQKITSNTDREYPNASDDVAIITFPNMWKTIQIPVDGITVGSIIMRNCGNWNGVIGYSGDDGDAILKLDRTDGKRPFVQVDNPIGGGQFVFGAGNGSRITQKLTVRNDDEGWDFILGAPHTRNAPYFNNINSTIAVYVEGLDLYIPKGHTFRLLDQSEFYYPGHTGSRYTFGFEYGPSSATTYSRLSTSGFAIVGDGEIEFDIPRDIFSFCLRFTEFKGTFKVTTWNRYYGYLNNGAAPLSPNVAYEVNGAVSKADNLCEADLFGAPTNRSTQILLNADITSGTPFYTEPPENYFSCKYFRLNGGWVRLPRQESSITKRDPYVMRFDDFRLRGQGYLTKVQNYDTTRTIFFNTEIAKLTRETERDSLMVNGANVNNRIDFNRYGTYVIPDLEKHLVGTPDEESDSTGVYQIVPWMVLGENDNGGNGADIPEQNNWVWQLRFATVTNGVVARTTNFSTDINTAVEDANVVARGFTLSKDVTVNSLVIESAGNIYLKGHTLKVKSGAMAMSKAGDDCRINLRDESKLGGTLELGSETLPGYIHATCLKTPKEGQHSIWADIVAPAGVVKCLPGRLFIYGNQAGIKNDLYVNGGNLWLGYPSWGVWSNTDAYDWQTIGSKKNSYPIGCTMTSVTNFTVRGGAVLGLAREGTKLWNDDGSALTDEIYPVINPNANITLEHAGNAPGRLALGTNYDATEAGVFTCGKLYIDGKSVERGTWGSSQSGAENIDDTHFYGPGVLIVLRDDLRTPTMIILR